MRHLIKTKILKIFPFWLSGLVLITALQSAVFLLNQKGNVPQTQAAVNNQPEVLGAFTSVRGENNSATNNPAIEKIKDPDVSTISAKSFLVFDLSSGQNLFEKNTSTKTSIASLTKLLTAFVAYQNSDLNRGILITVKDVFGVKPSLNLRAGDSIKALDIFNSMLVGSCNDAALSLANYVAGSTGKNFVDMMNSQAAALGMQNSNFSNPIGFDNKNNYSTAEDIKILISSTEQLAAFKNLGRRTDYSFVSSLGHSYSTVATNKLIKNHLDIEAIKTGFTAGAQGAMATKISISGRDIVILVLGSQDREGDTLKLRDEVLNDFKWE